MLPAKDMPSVADLRLFMDSQGFDEAPPGPAGSLWTHDQLEVTLALPKAKDPMALYPLVSELADLSRVHVADMAQTIKYFSYDMADFRAASNLLDEFDSIPLLAAETIISNVRYLLRSCGTTAFRTQADLKGHYSSYGRDVMNTARMAHTKKGSFIIPVIVRLALDELSISSGEDDLQSALIGRRRPEPVERRVLRTMAQSLHAVSEAIVRPGTEPTADSLHAAVDMGVSREMCLALHEMLEQPVVNELETTFQWAPAYEASASTPEQVSIPAESRDLIEMAATKLKNNRIEPSRTISGAIIALRHVPNTDVGFITISTARNGRPAEVIVQLSYEKYLHALEWHAQRRVLTVHGEVQGGRGQRLRIDDPVRCEPIEDLFSEMNSRRSKAQLAVTTTAGRNYPFTDAAEADPGEG